MSASRHSRIDIVCPAFNRSTAIRATIDSVLAQTVADWTLFVISDGCTDDTEEVVRAYHDPRIRVLRSGPFGHPGGPRNTGVAVATAPFVAYLDHDDRWLPDHLAVLLELLEAGAMIAAVGCVRVDEAGTEVDRSCLTDFIWHPELQTTNAMFEPSRVGHRRELLAEIGGWTTVHAGYEDWDLWFRAARHGYDFAVSSELTSVLTIGPRTRRNSLRPPQAVVFRRVADEATARAVCEAIGTPAHLRTARAIYYEEIYDWHAAIAGSDRYRVAANVDRRRVEAGLHTVFAGGGKPGLLEGLSYALVRGRYTILLPLWCATGEHARAIGVVLRARFARQHAYLDALVDELTGAV